jgi:tetratricopeptide (TPR) repeat protein
MVGRCFDNGWATAEDPAAAAEQYHRAADAGHAWAQYNLGHLYLDGRGMPRDAVRAYAYYLRAAEQRHERAMNLAGRCCEEGWGRARDLDAAAGWYQRSAEAGYFRGQYNWASMLLNTGRAAEAAVWFERAVAGGPETMRRAEEKSADRRGERDGARVGQAGGRGAGAQCPVHQRGSALQNLSADVQSLRRGHAIRHACGRRGARDSGHGPTLGTDLSATLFLTPPESYEGGELVIDSDFGREAAKLAAGDLIIYTSTARHRVTPVTRGVRVSCVFWIQSLIRDDLQREQLFELDRTIQRLTELQSDPDCLVRLAGHYHTLLRLWTEI